ncbi:MAG: hypothetical protein SCARUB_03459 [Candidatus Scalindua rubra]|uniref:Uncharacterized protein n=1 Tax=Candidatus Scalindua rubra TaxID=1872076 RepID=A0A1E3X707_9BACT|nr:MAG: hypothetical protein SCARUB_03459 [Candidatus Scalindua rubra]
MRNVISVALSVFVFIIFSSVSINSFADIGPMDDAQGAALRQSHSGGQDSDITALKKQLDNGRNDKETARND